MAVEVEALACSSRRGGDGCTAAESDKQEPVAHPVGCAPHMKGAVSKYDHIGKGDLAKSVDFHPKTRAV